MDIKQPILLDVRNAFAFQNALTGTPLAGHAATLSLTSSQRDSVTEIVTGLYLTEEDQQKVQSVWGIGNKVSAKHEQRVFVLSYKNKPLMPCSPRKARILLKEGKAIVVSARPFFTIKLNYNTGGATQPIKMGIDTGYEYLGFALVGIYCYLVGQIKLDNKMSKRLSDRAMYRRSRRNRLRYRPMRVKNRRNQRNKDLPPSVQRRIDRHIKIIEKLQLICPITDIIIEGATFDIQKLNNPEIEGTDYQEGALFRSNLRSYLFSRENGICQYCGKKINFGERTEMHHIIQRSDGGTNKPNNFALLHDKCHQTMHKKNDFSKLKTNKQYKAETFMNTLRKRLFARFPDAVETFGYVTSAKRKELGLSKEHYIDAFVIAGGNNQVISMPLKLAEYRKNNRSLQVQKKGKQIAIRRKRYPIQPGDLIWIGKKKYISKGSTGLGKYVWIHKEGKKVRIPVSKITKVFHFGTLGYES